MTLETSSRTVDAASAQVLAAFARYERALVAGDSSVLSELFLDSPQTSRFGIADEQVGAAALAAWRAQQGPLPGRRLSDTRLVMLGDDAAVVTTTFDYPGRAFVGRQSQTWLRTEAGWRIVHAHVSEIPTG